MGLEIENTIVTPHGEYNRIGLLPSFKSWTQIGEREGGRLFALMSQVPTNTYEYP